MGAGWPLATPSSSTTVPLRCRSFTFIYEHNHQSLSSDSVDDAPYCELKLRGQSSCYWLEPSGSRHRLTLASKGLLREVQ